MKNAQKELLKVLEANAYRHSTREVFEAFVRVSACACAYGTREEAYMSEIARWEKDEQKRFVEAFALLVDAVEEEPFSDVLGPIHMELGSRSSQKWGGEFYTPAAINKLMAQMTFLEGQVEVEIDRPITLLEPSCGSGGLVLAAAERMLELGFSPLNLLATCIDISAIACDMCFINLTLNSVPATIVHGNTLSLETWGAWRTVTYNMARGLASPAEVALMKLLRGGEPIETKEEPLKPEPVTEIEAQSIVTAAAKMQPGLFEELEVAS